MAAAAQQDRSVIDITSLEAIGGAELQVHCHRSCMPLPDCIEAG